MEKKTPQANPKAMENSSGDLLHQQLQSRLLGFNGQLDLRGYNHPILHLTPQLFGRI